MLTMAIFSLCTTSCSKDDSDETNNNSTEQPQQEPTYLQASDLQGVGLFLVLSVFTLSHLQKQAAIHYALTAG